MRSHDVHHLSSIELAAIVGAHHYVSISRQDVIQTGLVFNQVVDSGQGLESPFRACNHTSQSKTLVGTRLKNLLNEYQHAVLIKITLLQVSVLPRVDFQRPMLFFLISIDSRSLKAAQMIVIKSWMDDMKCPFSTLDAFSYEGQEHTIFFFGSVKESADMPMLIESRCRQVNGMFDTIHDIS